MSYQCAAVDAVTNDCTEWVAVVNPFIPEMTAAEGQEIGLAILLAFVATRVIILLQKAITWRQD